jgi:hypothetical protein
VVLVAAAIEEQDCFDLMMVERWGSLVRSLT